MTPTQDNERRSAGKKNITLGLTLVLLAVLAVGIFIIDKKLGLFDMLRFDMARNRTANVQVAGNNLPSDWLTATDAAQGLTFKYPKEIPLFHSVYTYNVNLPWPPRIAVRAENFACEPKSLSPSNNTTVVKKNINGRSYCVSRSTEGAAGSTYETYGYTTMLAGKLATASFIMFGPTSCDVYDNGTGDAADNQKFNACKKELSVYSSNLDDIIDTMMQSVKFN